MLERSTAHPLDTLAFNVLNAEQRQLAESVPLAQRAKQCFEETANAMQDSWLQARDALDKRHKQNVMERERTAGREVRARTSSTTTTAKAAPQFAIGDFVLVQCPIPRNKLKLKWLGPYKVVDTVSEWIYILEDIVTLKRSTVHVQRIRFYHDASFEVTEDVRNQAQYDGILEFTLEELVDWRESDAGTLEIRVRWLGFEANEDTWEPVERLQEDVPVVLHRYLRTVEDVCPLALALLQQQEPTGSAPPERTRGPGTRCRGRPCKQRK